MHFIAIRENNEWFIAFFGATKLLPTYGQFDCVFNDANKGETKSPRRLCMLYDPRFEDYLTRNIIRFYEQMKFHAQLSWA